MSGTPLPEECERAYDEMTDESLTIGERLEAAYRLRRYLRDFEPVLVREARKEGASWQAVGDALGITRQAAHYRYARAD